MPKFLVTIPIAGFVSTEIEADSESLAREIALEQSFDNSDIVEWSIYDALMKSNLCQVNGPHEVEIEEI